MAPTFRLREWFRARALLLLALAAWAYGTSAAPVASLWGLLAVWLLSYLGLGSFGYFVNDCFDIAQDLAAGKRNRVAFFSPLARAGIVLALLALAFSPWALLPWQPWVSALLLVQALLLCVYAIPPFRLKSRAAGLVADALYAFVLPAGITVAAFGMAPATHNALMLCALGCALFLTGLRNILLHHLRDREADAVPGSDTYNLALRLPVALLERRICTRLIPLELVCWLAAMLSLGREGAPAAAIAGIYLVQMVRKMNLTDPAWLNPLHDTWLPLALGGMMFFLHPATLWPLLLAFLPMVPWLLLFRLGRDVRNRAWLPVWLFVRYLLWDKCWHRGVLPLWYRILATPLGKPYYFLYNLLRRK
ncbi:MAG: hypothetical protein EAZ89_13590 [Bacteroidetes bacterium]|nr:MAG: hypothetical protein EAZ89_13590 [Bacteroidota bacterium]